jgi:hypothetical protein
MEGDYWLWTIIWKLVPSPGCAKVFRLVSKQFNLIVTENVKWIVFRPHSPNNCNNNCIVNQSDFIPTLDNLSLTEVTSKISNTNNIDKIYKISYYNRGVLISSYSLYSAKIVISPPDKNELLYQHNLYLTIDKDSDFYKTIYHFDEVMKNLITNGNYINLVKNWGNVISNLSWIKLNFIQDKDNNITTCVYDKNRKQVLYKNNNEFVKLLKYSKIHKILFDLPNLYKINIQGNRVPTYIVKSRIHQIVIEDAIFDPPCFIDLEELL